MVGMSGPERAFTRSGRFHQRGLCSRGRVMDGDSKIDRLLVCVLPEGFEMTAVNWSRIFEYWKGNGRRLLQADEVTAIFKSGRESQSSK